MKYRWAQWIKRQMNHGLPSAGLVQKVRGIEDPAIGLWCRQWCEEKGLFALSARVIVLWNSGMRTTAGRAWWPLGVIQLNPKLKSHGEEEVWRTVKHELAHLVAYERAGRKRIAPHGIEWREACVDLGIEGESVRHQLPFEVRRQVRKFGYICPHCKMRIEKVRRIQKKVACAMCCNRHGRGVYDARFRLIEEKIVG